MKPGYTIATDVMHPKSRGRISLNSRDINVQPKIEPNYFSHPDDVRDAVFGAQLALRIGLAPPFKKHGAKVYDQPSPRCKHLKLFSDAYRLIPLGQIKICGFLMQLLLCPKTGT